MHAIIRRIMFISVFLLPFIIFTRGFYGAVFGKVVYIELLALIIGSLWLIGKVSHREKEPIHGKGIFFIFGSYVLVLLISGFHGVMPALSFWSSFDQGMGILFMFCLGIIALVTSIVLHKIEDWYKLFTIFSWSGIIFSLGCLLAGMGVHFSRLLSLDAQNGFSIGNSSWAGVYLSFVFFISLGLTVASKNRSQKIAGIIGMITAFLNPTLSGFLFQYPGMHFGPIGLAQTTSYALFASSGLFILYLFFRKITALKWRKVFLWSFLSVALIGIIMLFVIGLNPVKKIIAEKAGPNRLVYWQIALKGFKEKPVLGWGGDSYQYIYGKHFDPIILTPGYAKEYWVDKSHSIYFDELATGGILGFVSLISLYGAILFGLLRKAIKERQKEGMLYMALGAGMVSFLIQGIMLFQTIIGWFVVMLLMVFVARFCFSNRLSTEEDVKHKHKKKEIKNTTVDTVLIAGICFVFCFAVNYIVITPYTINRGMSELPKMPYTQRLAFLEELDKAYVGNVVDLGNLFLPYHVRIREIIKKGITEEQKNLIVKEITVLNTVIDTSLARQQYMDMKLLMGGVGFQSIVTGLVSAPDQAVPYEKGIFYVNKMKEISTQNPIVDLSKNILDVSLKYGIDGVNAFETDKSKVKR